MSTRDAREAVRAEARSFEEGLPKDKRKRLGQYFTGVRLGKLLAHLALMADARSVLDPMAGHGDLLDATAEAALERGIKLERLDGIEIDDATAEVCRYRLNRIAGDIQHKIISGSAFDPVLLEHLPIRQYDLVITNPPYIRYQAQNGRGGQGETSRSGLLAIVERQLSGSDKVVWSALAKGYSGLADLSVPAWLLAGLLVRPGGKLALVVPATWRSRDYGDVIRYLLLRCFKLECVVEDTQPGWFSDALVRTHLLVATRLPPQETRDPLIAKINWPTPQWLHVSPPAASPHSLVGSAFSEDLPEWASARWLSQGAVTDRVGIQVRSFNLREEYSSLRTQAARRAWFRALEAGDTQDLPLFGARRDTSTVNIPEAVRDILGDEFATKSLSTLEGVGIRVGQGLRTGCNSFFYVEACDGGDRKSARVKTSATYGEREIAVPADAIRPVLRRQSELSLVEDGHLPVGRVLDLRHWILPEHAPVVAEAEATYRKCREPFPKTMPEELAAYVRRAATVPIEDRGGGKTAPELSAVRTNTRAHRHGTITPRFWYMLPDFAPRHLPAAFVARVIGGEPWVEKNFDTPILIDANFSTFWAPENGWTAPALKALLNSTWCQLSMEALGTPLGGGALKLEAAHLRQLLIPALSKGAMEKLHVEGERLRRDSEKTRDRIDIIVLKALCAGTPNANPRELATMMANRSEILRRMRHRIAA
jgi:methylase of polypeptide subunit release factors